MSNLVNEKYTMQSCKCDCFIDTTHNQDGSVLTSLRVKALPDKQLLFAYMPQEGLVRVNPENGGVESGNLLGELMSIRYGDTDKVVKFFKDNGFLFPISSQGLESFSIEDIFSIIFRVRETLNILSMLNKPRIQYKKIMSAICWLTLSPRILIRSIDEQKEEFTTCPHGYMEFLESQRKNNDYDDLQEDLYEADECDFDDTIYPPEITISTLEISEMLNDPKELLLSGKKTGLSKLDAFLVFQDKPFGKGHLNENKVIDYFYHLTKEVGDIVSIQNDKAAVSFSCGDKEVADRLSPQMQSATIDVAKITIKEELDYAINAIYPSYDIEAMTGSWVIPDLYSALVFSVFYINHKAELYRECENPNCGQYFLVSTTNSRRKYCSPECSNAMQQRKYRQKKKASTEVNAEN